MSVVVEMDEYMFLASVAVKVVFRGVTCSGGWFKLSSRKASTNIKGIRPVLDFGLLRTD